MTDGQMFQMVSRLEDFLRARSHQEVESLFVGTFLENNVPMEIPGDDFSPEEWRQLLTEELKRRQRQIRISVTISRGNQAWTGEIDPEEYFLSHLSVAISNGKDPVDALTYLADAGAQLADVKSPGYLNRVGK